MNSMKKNLIVLGAIVLLTIVVYWTGYRFFFPKEYAEFILKGDHYFFLTGDPIWDTVKVIGFLLVVLFLVAGWRLKR